MFTNIEVNKLQMEKLIEFFMGNSIFESENDSINLFSKMQKLANNCTAANFDLNINNLFPLVSPGSKQVKSSGSLCPARLISINYFSIGFQFS